MLSHNRNFLTPAFWYPQCKSVTGIYWSCSFFFLELFHSSEPPLWLTQLPQPPFFILYYKCLPSSPTSEGFLSWGRSCLTSPPSCCSCSQSTPALCSPTYNLYRIGSEPLIWPRIIQGPSLKIQVASRFWKLVFLPSVLNFFLRINLGNNDQLESTNCCFGNNLLFCYRVLHTHPPQAPRCWQQNSLHHPAQASALGKQADCSLLSTISRPGTLIEMFTVALGWLWKGTRLTVTLGQQAQTRTSQDVRSPYTWHTIYNIFVYKLSGP